MGFSMVLSEISKPRFILYSVCATQTIYNCYSIMWNGKKISTRGTWTQTRDKYDSLFTLAINW